MTMRLSTGARFGSYEILAPLGAGGMGEVYRARDTRLKRDVALKVLQGPWLDIGDRVARFEREAELLAALNHPNVAAIYGIEESSGTTALVLELVEGPTLADRLALGPMPLSEVVPICRQIVDALDAAHERGIVHRDLKPANIKLRDDGAVKVLDFGLAKALGSDDSARQGATAFATVTSPVATSMGVILGTAAYMSPEQARGQPLDKRTDIWAFGCVLYEMLCGRMAFARATARWWCTHRTAPVKESSISGSSERPEASPFS
jgi:serine/threonine protein kinase